MPPRKSSSLTIPSKAGLAPIQTARQNEPLLPRVGILRAVGEILFGEPDTLGVRFGDVDSFDLEHHGTRAVVAAGNHHAIVRGPAMHDGSRPAGPCRYSG